MPVAGKAGGNAHHVAFRNTTVDMAFRKYLLENSRLCRGCQIGIQDHDFVIKLSQLRKSAP